MHGVKPNNNSTIYAFTVCLTIHRLKKLIITLKNISLEDVRLQQFTTQTEVTAVKVVSQNNVARHQNIMFKKVPLNEGNCFNSQRRVVISTK